MTKRSAARLIIILLFIAALEAKRTKQLSNYGLCTIDQYRCENEKCIKKTWFCDGSDDCGDNSDEKYCHLEKTNRINTGRYEYQYPPCPSHYKFHKCSNMNRCIPSIWKCDGNEDCTDGSDEVDCSKGTIQLENYGSCAPNSYRCENGDCISRSYFCDDEGDCGDNSDEEYCNMEKIKLEVYEYQTPPCPSHYPFHMCSSEQTRCIPSIWKCDGNQDCLDGSDEVGCLNDVEKISGSITSRGKAITWLQSQRQITSGNRRWGTHTPRTAIALFLSNQNYFDGSNIKGNEIAYEVENQVLASMIEDQNDGITMNELAIYIHALLVTCVNPKDFHGIDLVAKLRREANKQENYTNPLVMLTLCNAGDKMTNKDVDKVTNAFYNEQRPFWKSTQALALMALSCINERLLNSTLSSVFNDMSFKLKKNQLNNGSFENMQTTALVMQAIFASGKEDNDWDMDEAIKFLVRNQGSDGSYGSFLNTYYVLPVLYYKSLLNISSSHCNISSSKEGGDILFHLRQKIGKKISIKYFLIYGDQSDLVRSLALRVTQNSTFFDVMNLAKTLDEKYSFEYSFLESKPYVYSMDGLEEDPENENYWFLYKAASAGFQNSKAIHSSPIDVVPKDGEEYAMWYRRGHWFQNSEAFVKRVPLTDPKHLDEKYTTSDNTTKSYKSTTSNPGNFGLSFLQVNKGNPLGMFETAPTVKPISEKIIPDD